MGDFWSSLDLVIKFLFPCLAMFVGWITRQIKDLERDVDTYSLNMGQRLTAIESNRVKQQDLLDLERRFMTQLQDTSQVLHSIDNKVTAIQSRLEEQDRRDGQPNKK